MISTSACSRRIAVVWRKTWGETVRVLSVGHWRAARATVWLSRFSTPERVRGWPQAVLKQQRVRGLGTLILGQRPFEFARQRLQQREGTFSAPFAVETNQAGRS